MARFLLAAWPGIGHIYPNIALLPRLYANGVSEVASLAVQLPKRQPSARGFRYFRSDQVAYRLRATRPSGTH